MLRALVKSVLDAPGKFAVVNIAAAGSVVSTPMVIAGIGVCVTPQRLTCVKLNPNVRLWALRATLRLSLMFLVGVLLRLGPVTTVALVMPAALMPRLNPCWLANCAAFTSG